MDTLGKITEHICLDLEFKPFAHVCKCVMYKFTPKWKLQTSLYILHVCIQVLQ